MITVSVIIPTAGKRRQLLLKAIHSAREGLARGEVEVIVVPNGPDRQWKEAIECIQREPCVRVIPVEPADANIARNTGLANSRGQLIRFLDDDDYLNPAVAVTQYKELLATGADISSYAINIEDQGGYVHDTLRQPAEADFVTAQLSPNRMQLVHAHVYSRSCISELTWKPSTSLSEDILWLLKLASTRDLKWVKADDIVGAWFQHDGERLSSMKASQIAGSVVAEEIISTVGALQEQARITEKRLQAAASGLWDCAHHYFYLRPFYWHNIAKTALTLWPSSRPSLNPPFNNLINIVNPLLFEWIMLPKRIMNHTVRTRWIRKSSYVRTIGRT